LHQTPQGSRKTLTPSPDQTLSESKASLLVHCVRERDTTYSGPWMYHRASIDKHIEPPHRPRHISNHRASQKQRVRYRRGERLPCGRKLFFLRLDIAVTHNTRERVSLSPYNTSLWSKLSLTVSFRVTFQKDLHCTPLGHESSFLTWLQRLMISIGVSSSEVTRCAGKLAKHAVHYGHLIVRTRRLLKATLHTSAAGQTHGTHTGIG
jgi:hypothetical protein